MHCTFRDLASGFLGTVEVYGQGMEAHLLPCPCENTELRGHQLRLHASLTIRFSSLTLLQI